VFDFIIGYVLGDHLFNRPAREKEREIRLLKALGAYDQIDEIRRQDEAKRRQVRWAIVIVLVVIVAIVGWTPTP
jgi:hypothetical protein